MSQSNYRSRERISKRIFSLVTQLVCICLGLVVMFPVIYAFLISFMEPAQVLSRTAGIIPERWTLDNYAIALRSAPLMRFMWNSLVISIVSTVIRVLVSALAAYAFAFFNFRGKSFLFLMVLGTFMIPGDVVLIGNYQTAAGLGLINTYTGMMMIFLVSGMNIFMLRQSFKAFSADIRDAAYVDGCGNFRLFWNVVLPTNISTLLTVSITGFMGTWNTYLWPLLVTNRTEMRTIQVGITMMNFSEGTVHGPIMAASIIVLVPALMLFLIFQNHIKAGMMAGGVKG